MRLRTLAVGKRAILAALMKLEHLVRRTPTTLDDLSGIKDFLFLQYEQPLGTAVHATPVFEALKSASPDAAISVACCGMALEVLKHNPFVDRLIVTPNPYSRLIAAATAIRRAWSPPAEGDACIVTTAGSTRSKIALLGLFSGRGVRVGHTLARSLYHQVVDYDPAASLIENDLRVLERLGRPYRHYEPRVFFVQRDLEAAAALLAVSGLAEAMPLIVFATQGSGSQPTAWQDDRFAAVADHLASHHGAGVAFIGSPAQADAINRIRRLMRHESVNLAGKTDIPTLAALLCRSDAVVTLDTGSMHVARAGGVPTLIVAAAWQPPHEWLPLGIDTCRIVQRKDVSWVDHREPFRAMYERMDEIGSEAVIAGVDTLLSDYPPSADARRLRVNHSLASPARAERV